MRLLALFELLFVNSRLHLTIHTLLVLVYFVPSARYCEKL